MISQAVDILLLDLPVALWSTTAEHHERLRAALPEHASRAAPRRLLAMLDGLADAAEVAAPSELELRAAAARGLKEVDVAYGIPRSARDGLAALPKAYADVDRYFARLGRDDLVTPPECAAFRTWFLSQLVGQLDGGFPTAWKG